MTRTKIRKAIEKSLGNNKSFKGFSLEVSSDPSHGDYASNVAFLVSGKSKKNPLEVAKDLRFKILKLEPRIFEKVEVAKPGFLNFFLAKEYLQ